MKPLENPARDRVESGDVTGNITGSAVGGDGAVGGVIGGTTGGAVSGVTGNITSGATGGDGVALEKLGAVTDALLDALLRAAGELGSTCLHSSRKEKTLVYANPDRPDKPSAEIVTEQETLDVVPAPVDPAALKTLAAALREVKGALFPGLDRRERLAQVAALERQLDAARSPEQLEIRFAEDVEACAE